MANLMARGMAFLAAKLPEAAAVTVAYRRGVSRVTLTDAVPANEAAQSVPLTPRPARTGQPERDYLIPAASLVIDGAAVLPRAGDEITETIGTAVTRFVVEKRADAPEWDWADESRLTLRVRTKQAHGA